MENLLENQKTLIISSIDGDINPKISYSPYVFMNNKFYIYISKVAEHYKNIINNNKVSIMIIEDEKDSKISFARNRLSFSGATSKIEDNEEVLNLFRAKHGKEIMDMLVKMDFNIFEIEVHKGRLVKGFGKAFDVIIEDNNLVLKEVIIKKGHK